MASDFKYIIFSIFDISDFNEVTDVVKLIFKRELEKGKAYIYPICPVIKEYINPQSGGSHFPKFSCWQNEMYPDKVFFISNYEDGLSNLCRTIEDQSYYKNIKKRLNNSIIKEYLLKLGIDLCLIDSKISKGFVFIRKEW